MPLWRRRVSDLGAVIAQGWNGMPWGSSLQEFRARFPKASKTDSDWWLTGDGPEPFCGVAMAYTQYGFNARDQFYWVTFIPDTPQRGRLTPAVFNALGAPSGQDAVWHVGDVVVEVKTAGVLATMSHRRYARHA
jgi:hypothetical protein